MKFYVKRGTLRFYERNVPDQQFLKEIVASILFFFGRNFLFSIIHEYCILVKISDKVFALKINFYNNT